MQVGPVLLGGLTPEQARDRLQSAADDYLRKGFTFLAPERRVTIETVIIAPEDPDLYYELLRFDIETMVRNAYSLGRGPNPIQNVWNIASALISKKTFPVSFELDRDRLGGILKQNFSSMEDPPKDAAWNITFVHGLPKFSVTRESGGYVFNYSSALYLLEESIAGLVPKEIKIKHRGADPRITAEDVKTAIPEAKKILAHAPLEVKVNDTSWEISKEKTAEWLIVQHVRDGSAKANLDKNKIKESLGIWGKNLGLSREPKNAKFELKAGKVVEFQSSENGLELESEENISAIQKALLTGEGASPLALKLAAVEPEFRTDEVNTYGIKELIGKATTSFAGSPKNRRFNIKVAVEKLNGLLIPAEEEFSLVRAIGSVDAEAGFKEELVIKGDKTTPEFGGGLCQIASTVFRSALKTGLPILERQNHSYRVPYYEPPIGMDATIYLPKPDLRFKNDTGAAILILASVSGNNLTFEFWGANDGRVAETSEPEVTNIVAPPPTKIVYTEELPPGVKKCTELAHVGSDAKFTYSITRADGTKEEKIFRSHYRPWQEVCLLGVVPGTATNTEKTALIE